MKKLITASVAIAMIVAGSAWTAAANPQQRRPNVIFILIDDLRWDDLGISGHPFVKTPNIDRIGREGVMFRNAFMTTPLCSPSRASFLTGQYPHTHGITDNVDRSAASHKLITFPLLLQQSGYATAFIGKWHMGNDDSRRPGFDRWVSFKGQGSYVDPEINEDGNDVKPAGYITDLLTGYAVEFIKRKHDKPYLVYLAHKAIHPEVMQHDDGSVNLADAEQFIPAERHRNLFTGQKIPRRPSAMRAPVGKPALQRKIEDLPPLGANTATRDEAVLGRLRSLMAIEEGVGEIMKALTETNQLDNTAIVLTSDNGYFYGEHGLSVERRLAYEESIRMPLLIRYPAAVKAGTMRDEFALNIDLAPTLLDLAGVAIPASMEGNSLVALLNAARTDWRKSFLLEYYSDRVFPRIRQMGYKAVRNERWKYIHYFELEGMDELYDLEADPYEMTNIINQPNAAKTLEEMKSEMQRLLNGSQRTLLNGSQRASSTPVSANSPDSVIRQLYRIHNDGRGHVFEAEGKKHIYRFFDLRLADLIWKSITETPEGEVGNLDFDPLYNAQDTQIKNFQIGKPVMKGDNATVLVNFRNFVQRITIKFEMIKVKEGWKISNIIYGGDSDLKKILSQ